MLMKTLLQVPGNYEKTLKLRRAAAIGMMALGAVGLACWHWLVPESGLPDFAQGFYLGASSGIILGALILLCRTQYLLSHPEARKRAKVKEQDEREKTILNRSFQMAGVVTFFVAAAALLVVLPFSRPAFSALLAVMVFYFLAFVAGSAYYSKKL